MDGAAGIICICGPTASGKTALAVALAQKLGGEVVSCDSMQIYRGMDIGTAKPSPEECAGIPHHMIDIASPNEDYSAARYVEEASACVDGIIARGKVPIVAGGTGLYMDALIDGRSFAESGYADGGVLRSELTDIASKPGGPEQLHERLSKLDPETAQRLHVNDTKRVIRALEVCISTGHTMSEHNALSRVGPPRYRAAIIGLTAEPRQILYDRINARVDEMMRKGLLEEVRGLMSGGVLGTTARQAIGYKELASYISGECGLDEAVEEIKLRSRQYAKRQLTWFRREPDVLWLNIGDSSDLNSICADLTEFAKRRGVI